jgi:hypothetical protein
MLDRFFRNQHYIDYVRLLFDLHKAISEGWDETASGEAQRDLMDKPGRWLSSDEITSVSGISADFYSLTDADAPSIVRPPLTADAWAALQPVFQPRKSRDLHGALELLRQHAGSIPPASVAYCRGKIWMEAEEYPIAAAFLKRASELDVENANFRYLALHALEKANSQSAIQMAQDILRNSEQHPSRLVLKALDVLIRLIRSEGGNQPHEELKSFIPNIQNSIFQFETSGEVENDPSLLASSINHLAFLRAS